MSCLAWNQRNVDSLATGYGNTGFGSTGKGFLCIWSLKNPKTAVQMMYTHSGVSTIDFSSLRPNLLAVGLNDGSVSIHNIRRQKEHPSANRILLGKHRCPVWQVRWICCRAHKVEHVVSVSTEGQFIKWNSHGNLMQIDVLKLKKNLFNAVWVSREKRPIYPKENGFVKIRAICFDFSPKDASTYILGTESGLLHRCSCSIGEHFLNSYLGHDAPVYQVQWSPHLNQIFISASADWTVKLWHEKIFSPTIVFRTGDKHITGVCWAPNNSTVFACASLNGSIQVWDITKSTLEPIRSKKSYENIACLAFARDSSNVAAGHEDGTVSTFHISGLEFVGSKSSNRLRDAISNATLV